MNDSKLSPSRTFTPYVGRRIAGFNEGNGKRTLDSWLLRPADAENPEGPRKLSLENSRRWTLRDLLRVSVWGELHRLRLAPFAFPATVELMETKLYAAIVEPSALEAWRLTGKFVVLASPTMDDIRGEGLLEDPDPTVKPLFRRSNPLQPKEVTKEELFEEFAPVGANDSHDRAFSRIVIDLAALATRLQVEIYETPID